METTDGWHKGSRSGPNGACVESKRIDGVVRIRDSKLPPDAPQLDKGGFSELQAFVRATGGY